MSADTRRLEARYRRLLRIYPADYRRQRGEEIIDTYLEMAGTRRRWPSLPDAADLIAGSARQRLRATGPGLANGMHIAAVFALTTVSALAALWFFFVELTHEYHSNTPPAVGPFRGLGGFVWLAWLTAAAVAAVSPGRRSRWAITAALTASVAVVPIAALTPYDRPALMVLLPQAALGLVGLGLGATATRFTRLAPVSAAIAITALLQVFCLPHSPLRVGFQVSNGDQMEAGHLMPTTGILLGIAALVTAASYVVQGRADGLRAALILLTPVAMCFIEPAARRISGDNPWEPAGFNDMVITSVGLTLAASTVAVGLNTVTRRLRS